MEEKEKEEKEELEKEEGKEYYGGRDQRLAFLNRANEMVKNLKKQKKK